MADEQMMQLAINTIRTLAMDAVQQARSGHPGTLQRKFGCEPDQVVAAAKQQLGKQ